MREGFIYVAAHKAYRMPEDALYRPIQVGSGAGLGFLRDDTGENIAGKNANYCELTALYWVWRNTDGDFAGLAHYRRHFAGRGGFGRKWARVMTRAELDAAWDGETILVPQPRRYRIETNWSQYAHAHHEEDLRVCRAVLGEMYPGHVGAFDAVMARTWGHRFNMFVMRRGDLEAYCGWLFGVLFEVEKRLDIRAYGANDARVFGFLGERLLDVWLEAEGKGYREVPVMFMEKENWLRKGWRFLMRKARG